MFTVLSVNVGFNRLNRDVRAHGFVTFVVSVELKKKKSCRTNVMICARFNIPKR